MPRTIADILRRLGEVPPSDMEIVSGPPVSPWLDVRKIAAANARDVVRRRDDDRSLAWRREISSRALAEARLSRGPRFRFGAQITGKRRFLSTLSTRASAPYRL
jgi:hypothetical protein